jgi:hypothetical protein
MGSATPSRGAQRLVVHPRQLEDDQALIRSVKGNQTVVLIANQQRR